MQSKIQKILLLAFALLIAIAFSPTLQTVSGQAAVEDPPRQQAPESDEQESEPKADSQKESTPETNSDQESDRDESEEGDEEDAEQRLLESQQELLLRNRFAGRSLANRKFSKKSPGFTEVFEPVSASVSESTAVIMDGRRRIAMGTIVDPDGYILTKASELRGAVKCKLSNGKSYEAVVHGVDPETDLAILKIEATDLPSMSWSDREPPETGRWLVTPSINDKLIGVGIVSVNARAIPPSRPFVGIVMQDIENASGVRIDRVLAGTAADRAGIRVNDIVIKFDDVDIPDRDTLFDTIGQYSIGEVAQVTIRRGDRELKLGLLLGDRDKDSPDNARRNTQNNMGSTLSKRRKDFPMAFQHDSMLSAKDCGGAIVDLDGKVVGINIARAGRVSSLALPQSVVIPIIEKLKTGEYTPARVNAEQIREVDQELQSLAKRLEEFPKEQSRIEKQLAREDARSEELERMVKDMEKALVEMKKRLESAEELNEKASKDLRNLRREIRAAKGSKRSLESKRKRLQTGSG